MSNEVCGMDGASISFDRFPEQGKTCGLCQKSASYAKMVEKKDISGSITQIYFLRIL